MRLPPHQKNLLNLQRTSSKNQNKHNKVRYMKKTFLYTLLITMSLVFVFSCSKKEQKQTKGSKYKVEGDYFLPSTFTLSGLHIKDTANHIYGALLLPVCKIKDNSIDVRPLRFNVSSQMKAFMEKVKKDKSGNNHFIEIRPYYFIYYDSLYSCLFQKRTSLNGKDTLTEYNSMLYNFAQGKKLDFDDIFSVNENNLSSFLALYPQMKGYSLSKLKNTDFNIEMDSISFNLSLPKPDKNCMQKRIKQSKTNLRPFIKSTIIFHKALQR